MHKALLLLVLGVGRGCWERQTPEEPSREPSEEHQPLPMVQRQTLAHPPGTLLRDERGAYWVVDRWPERRPLLDRFFAESHYHTQEAITLSAEEAQCLRPTTRLWYPRSLWRLVELLDGTRWYISEAEQARRLARSSVILAWRDDLAHIEPVSLSREAFERRYRLLDAMPPPDGALFEADTRYAMFVEGRVHLFESETLMRSVGYDPRFAVPVSLDTLLDLGERGETYTATFFSTCPLAAAELRTTEDHDHDGVPFFQDCDDDDARRHPNHPEICDGIDNDCDLIPDNGFDVGTLCTMANACHTQTYRRCADHRLGTVCDDPEAVCE